MNKNQGKGNITITTSK